MSDLETAIEVALLAHKGQKDKAGMPYILHPLRVAQSLTYDEDLAMIAVLHDVVEDTHIDLAALERYGFSERVLTGVDAMTKRKDEKYDDYIARVAQNFDACRVKMADVADNKDFKRLPPHLWRWFAGMSERYLQTEAKLEVAIADHIRRQTWRAP